jgi:DNA repair photolyase
VPPGGGPADTPTATALVRASTICQAPWIIEHMFATLPSVATRADRPRIPLRWHLAEEDDEGTLFPDETAVTRHVGTGEFRGMEFLHVNARSIINPVPAASRMSFRYTINPYRGCSHACTYCMSADTLILMGDGTTKPMVDVRKGELVYGTVRRGDYRRFAITEVLDHWSTVKPAYRTTLDDGTQLVTSGDHRFLSDRGWKHVTGTGCGAGQRPHLTLNNTLLGTGGFATGPAHDADYQRGYLCGMIRGDGTLGAYGYGPEKLRMVYRFRLALVDGEGLQRTADYLARAGVPTRERCFQPATATTKQVDAIVNSSRAGVRTVTELIEWGPVTSDEWAKGFLAGIFDAEGSYSRGILRFANTDSQILVHITVLLRRFGFDPVVDMSKQPNGLANVRIRGGLAEHLRFFHTVDPAITRKRSIDGTALKAKRKRRVVSVEPLGIELPLYDMTTGTGDFVSDGVISHNCFARPTHDYLGLNIGEDFERRIVVKVNAVERLRAELRSPKWAGEHIAMGTNTDPYQLAEGKYHLTQGVVRTLTDARNPFSILTKSTLILRDLDLLVSAARRTSVHLNFSIGTLDRDVWKLTEPGTPPPERRLTAVRRFNDAGIPCGVLVAPVLPGLSDGDEQVREVVEAGVDAGAISVAAIPLHLRPGVREHFMGWLATARPDLVPLYERRFRRGSYQPKAEQARLAALVAGVLKKKGTGTRQVRRYIEDLDDPAGGGRSDASGDDIAGRGTAASETGAVTRPAAARAAARSAPTRSAPARPAGEQLRLL